MMDKIERQVGAISIRPAKPAAEHARQQFLPATYIEPDQGNKSREAR
jgi:hypothetical protein